MNGFHAFDDYRVSAWRSEGLMKRVENVVRSIEASLTEVASVAAIAVVLATSPTISVARTVLAPVANAVSSSEHGGTLQRDASVEMIDKMGSAIDHRLANFDDFLNEEMDFDLLDMASAAVAASAVPLEGSMVTWAQRLVHGS